MCISFITLHDFYCLVRNFAKFTFLKVLCKLHISWRTVRISPRHQQCKTWVNITITASLRKIQEPGWTWYVGHPIEFIIRISILENFDCLDNFGPFCTTQRLLLFTTTKLPFYIMFRCGGCVYSAEEVVEKGRHFHTSCFTCKKCSKPLADKLQVWWAEELLELETGNCL